MPEEPAITYVCQRCANCCKWPGEVKVTSEEISAIAQFLDMSETAFLEKHTALRENRQGLTLLEKPNGECEFLEGNHCRLQAVKPEQCRDFPNKWRFPGWRQVCEAIPVRLEENQPAPPPSQE
ncbi:MAG: YkgJ family cysteine cluster protein [Verrucomicrobiales bacterium]